MATHRYSDGYRSFREADPARQVAFEVLTSVRNEDAYANLVLPKVLKSFEGQTHLDQRDRAFAVELTYGTLREQGFLDWVISRNSSRPLSDIEGGIVDVLRLGVYQLLRMRVPDHAAVSQTVDLARQYLSAGPAKFINAVLRSAANSFDKYAVLVFTISPNNNSVPTEINSTLINKPRKIH